MSRTNVQINQSSFNELNKKLDAVISDNSEIKSLLRFHTLQIENGWENGWENDRL